MNLTNKLLKIKSKYILEELFNFVFPTLKFNIIYGARELNNKLKILYLKKMNFFKNKINNYQFNNIIEYINQFKKDFSKYIKDEIELNDFLFYGLSQKENFYLKLCDNEFNKIIKSIYFNENLNIEIEYLTKELMARILLVKDNKFTKNIRTI